MATKGKKGLGKGLGSLLGEAAVDSVENEVTVEQSSTLLRLTDIEPNALQPRRDFDEEALQDLADSIAKNGVLQPLAVRKMNSGLFEIIAGERRWRASRMAGLKEVPVIVLEADDLRAMELAMIENLQREDLNPVEEAGGYRTLMDQYGLTQEEVAEKVGRSRPVIANSIRLLALPKDVLELLKLGEISAGHARALLSLESAADRSAVAERIVSQDMSVRQVETFVKRLLQQEKPEKQETEISVNYLEVLQNDLGKSLGRKVKIVDGKKRGRVELEYYGKDDLNRLTELLGKLID